MLLGGGILGYALSQAINKTQNDDNEKILLELLSNSNVEQSLKSANIDSVGPTANAYFHLNSGAYPDLDKDLRIRSNAAKTPCYFELSISAVRIEQLLGTTAIGVSATIRTLDQKSNKIIQSGAAAALGTRLKTKFPPKDVTEMAEAKVAFLGGFKLALSDSASKKMMSLDGQSKEQHYAAYLVKYRKEADEGSDGAMEKLGVAYNLGQGVIRDYAAAVSWWRKAAEKGNANAQANLKTLCAARPRTTGCPYP